MIEEMEKKPKAYLLCGVSGTGKTTYARKLEQQGAHLLSVDEEMWRRFGPEFTRLPSARQRELTIGVEADIRENMAVRLREGNDVVIDSCLCKRFKRDNFRQAASEAGGEPVLIYMSADRETILQRLAGRKGEDPNDIIVTPEQLDRFLVNFQPPEDDEERLELTRS